MVNDASKLRIAIDIIGTKVAQKSVEIRTCDDPEKLKKLNEQFDELLKISNEVHAGNETYIDSVLEANRRN